MESLFKVFDINIVKAVHYGFKLDTSLNLVMK